MVLVVV